ncbi:hypothetical protein ACIQMJ_21095 [Actinosynnema sp. NPDC091369]
MRRIFKTISAVFAALAVSGTLGVIGSAPAQAYVKSACDGAICLAADIVGNTVKNATASTNDGAPAHLNIYVAGDSWWSPGNVREFRQEINRAYDFGTWVCADGWINGHLIGRPCVKVGN